ncbi:Predicted glycosyl hydrolase, GH43/DUF377 family [Verrucomicrobium sp. GAS474]|uniref:glycoside hydrolase family 130 protein n=1 Tax=Verrucomicrobium sp. GAS474 TaxID=1882831 RepID=UPI00087C6558|nr:glycoside hydrolase family 130 protein [Verrucomicrobium sp. GAS474]SDT97486.1 Predicted glycosyl hydrolase, GH43/DUF377 family [Verrucomicrobium sp. GAS474]
MKVTRTGLVLRPNAARVLFRPFRPGGNQRSLRIIARVLALSPQETADDLARVEAEFGSRHQRLRDYFLQRFAAIRPFLPSDQPLAEERRLLLGAYFTHEYSLEAAALFNPSIVPHPDQTGMAEGTIRFVLSLRATGEGHISSITFRTGTVDEEGTIRVDEPSRFVTAPEHVLNASYEKKLFLKKLQELGNPATSDDLARTLLAVLPEDFTLAQLKEQIVLADLSLLDPRVVRMLNLAEANYEVVYGADQPLTERVIFPVAPNESNGIEDARFVRFVGDDGSASYVATYTAYDGRVAVPQLLETDDFRRFRISTLNGPEVQNKGMALFPRKIGGRYAMLSRQDGENLYLMYSDDLHFWYTKTLLLKPAYPWEFLQIGNCGSPIETGAGWLVISHGVGAMRKYSLGAFLLDRDDPSRVLARLSEPLLSPDESEREGYVPNVVYSCGAMLHARRVIVPYAMSDSATSFATVPLEELLAAMRPVEG